MASVIRIRVLMLTFATVLSVTACVHAPETADPLLRRQALERWNACLERFDSNLEHYCDGHRRDVLATFPVAEQSGVNAVLLRQTHIGNESRSLQKVFGITDEDR